MKHLILVQRICILIFFMSISVVISANEYTAIYKTESCSTVVVSGTVPTASVATYKNTSNSAAFLTENKSAQLSVTSYEGLKVSQVILKMKSTKSYCATASLEIKIGSEVVYTKNTAKFSGSIWGASCDDMSHDIKCTLKNERLVSEGENIDITIKCTDNNIFIYSYTIVYAPQNSTQLLPPDNVTINNITSTSAEINWEEVSNATAYEISITDNANFSASNLSETTKIILDNLSPSTDYSLSIKSISSDPSYSNSEESSIANFSTAEVSLYTVVLHPGTGIVDVNSIVESAYHSGVILPAAILPNNLSEEYEFVGWSLSPLSVEIEISPNILSIDEKYFPTENVELFAVYKSFNNFGTKLSKLSTSFSEPDSTWIVKHSKNYYGWVLLENDTIFTPLLNNVFITAIDINMRNYMNTENAKLQILNTETDRSFSSKNLPNDFSNVSIDINSFMSGYLAIYPSEASAVMGVAIKSVDLSAHLPVYRYCHNVIKSLNKPKLYVEVNSTEIDLLWSEVKGVNSYVVHVNDQEQVVLDKSVHRYHISNLTKNEIYKLSIEAISSESNSLASKVDTLVATQQKNVDIYVAESDASSSDRTIYSSNSINNDFVDIGEYINFNVSENLNLKSLTLAPNSKLVVEDNKELFVERLILKSIDDSVPQIELDGNVKIGFATEFHKSITDIKRYMFFSLPYDCPLSHIHITALVGSNLGIYGENWLIARYDEEIRATKSDKILTGEASDWVDFTINDTLFANVGYIIACDEQMSFVFPQTSCESYMLNDSYNLNLIASDPDKSEDVVVDQEGWNLITLPMYSEFSGVVTFPSNHILDMPISMPDNFGVSYIQGLSSDMILSPFRSFFVQIPESGLLSFATEPTYVNNYDKKEFKNLKIKLHSDYKVEDYVTFTFFEDSPLDYWLGHDLEKMSSFSTKAQIYCLDHHKKLAVSAQNFQNKDTFNIGVYTPNIGNYRIETESPFVKFLDTEMSEVQPSATISFHSDGSNFYNERFKVIVDSTIVANDEIEEKCNNIYQVGDQIFINQLYSRSTVVVYNSLGQIVCSSNVTNGQYISDKLNAGMYILCVRSQNKNIIYKFIVR